MCAISINSYDSGIGASQKEKDLSRLLYRICGSGFILRKNVQKLEKAPLLHCSALCDLPETKKNRRIFQFFPHAGTVEENT